MGRGREGWQAAELGGSRRDKLVTFSREAEGSDRQSFQLMAPFRTPALQHQSNADCVIPAKQHPVRAGEAGTLLEDVGKERAELDRLLS